MFTRGTIGFDPSPVFPVSNPFSLVNSAIFPGKRPSHLGALHTAHRAHVQRARGAAAAQRGQTLGFLLLEVDLPMVGDSY